MIQFKHYSRNELDSGATGLTFRRYSGQLIKSRFAQFVEGTLEELNPEDFGNITTAYTNMLGGMRGLKKVVFPDSITTIEVYCFEYCTSLQEIVFPSKLTTLSYLFCGLLDMPPESSVVLDFSKVSRIPTLDGTATNQTAPFSYAKTIIVPSSLYNSWKSIAPWSTYSSIIVSK